jgi:hypothetical protein
MLKSCSYTWLATANQINAGEFDLASEAQREQLARRIRRMREIPGNSAK